MKELTEEEFLKQYDSSKFFKPSVTIDTIIFTIRDVETDNYRKLPEKKLQILLVKRREHPCINKWSLPGVIIQESEDFESTVSRCLSDKANISNIYLEQLYTWGTPDRDPRGRFISTSYMGLINSESINIKPGRNVDEISWFSVNIEDIKEKKEEMKYGYRNTEEISLELKNDNITLKSKINIVREYRKNNIISNIKIISSDLAFDHAKQIVYAIERLKNKVEHTTIAFNLMPEKFTLTKLQQTYEILLGKELLKANFRRKISDMVTETDEYDENQGHRPSKLFKFNEKYKEFKF